jgi:hypothetical protein
MGRLDDGLLPRGTTYKRLVAYIDHFDIYPHHYSVGVRSQRLLHGHLARNALLQFLINTHERVIQW